MISTRQIRKRNLKVRMSDETLLASNGLLDMCSSTFGILIDEIIGLELFWKDLDEFTRKYPQHVAYLHGLFITARMNRKREFVKRAEWSDLGKALIRIDRDKRIKVAGTKREHMIRCAANHGVTLEFAEEYLYLPLTGGTL
jgi:hypothetical protein